jgi:cytochrome b561
MTQAANVIALAPLRLRSKAGRFDQVTIALHWLTLALVFSQFTTAWLLTTAGDEAAGAAGLLTLHRSMGVVTWGVVVSRLIWRAAFAHKPPFPASMPKLQQWVARATEWGLYLLLLLQPLTGFGDSVFRGHAFALLAWRLPSLTHADKPLFHAMHTAHELGALALLLLIGLHAGAALLHGVMLRDGVLQRMLPWTARDR